MRTLRGHHLLCVHGFQGMGYNPDFIQKMTEIVDDMRNDQLDFPIRVVIDLDEACGSCPNIGDGCCNASPDSDEHVKSLDKLVIAHLGLSPGQVYHKSELIQRTIEGVQPDDLDAICKGCSWLGYGVCKAGIESLKREHRPSNV